MRGAYLDVNVDVPLLVIMEIDVWVALVGCHFRRVLLGVHSALHPIEDELSQSVAPTVVTTNYVPTSIAKQAMKTL